MPRKEKSPKPEKKTPKKRDLEDPAMQESDYNRLLKTALDQANAQREEQLKELEEKLRPGARAWLRLTSHCQWQPERLGQANYERVL